MSLDALSRRLARIEARRGGERVTGLVNLAGHTPGVAADAVGNWRAWVAAGRANPCGSLLILREPPPTGAEWSARWCPGPRSSS